MTVTASTGVVTFLGVRMGEACCTVGRCSASGCGDKIKAGTRYALLTAPDGEQVLCEEGCLDWFEHGHPDYGYPRGRIEWVRDHHPTK